VVLDGAENVLGQVQVIARGDQLDLGATRHRIGQSVTQQAGNVLIELQGRTDSFRFLIRDHDAKLTSSFDDVIADAGIEILRSPPGHRRRMPTPSGGSAPPAASVWIGH
jgi:hypothetical protein